MIKKILPAMIGAALVGGMAPALADVTVFGHLDTSIDYRDQRNSSTNLNCNTCSLGFKGSEDLGNGLKAIFKVDFQFDMTERNRVSSQCSLQQHHRSHPAADRWINLLCDPRFSVFGLENNQGRGGGVLHPPRRDPATLDLT